MLLDPPPPVTNCHTFSDPLPLECDVLYGRPLWWIMEFFYNVLRLPLVFLALLFIDRSQIAVLGSGPICSPSGLVLGPLLYTLFTADISLLFAKCSASGHRYADDVQAYVHRTHYTVLDITSFIASLATYLDSWMSSNRLSLNPSKTQLIWLGTHQLLLKLDFAMLAAQFPQFTFLTSVRDLE